MVSETVRLIEAMAEAGKTGSALEARVHPSGVHDPLRPPGRARPRSRVSPGDCGLHGNQTLTSSVQPPPVRERHAHKKEKGPASRPDPSPKPPSVRGLTRD